jgi:hypothetical protein
MQREHAIEPLSGIARAGPYRRRTGSSRHLNTLAGLGSRAFSPGIGCVGIHVLGPADPKGRPNPILKVDPIRVILMDQANFPGTRPLLYAYLTFFCRKNVLCGAQPRRIDIGHTAL